MLIDIRQGNEPLPSELTPESIYQDRRRFMQLGAAGVVAAAAGSLAGRVQAQAAAASNPQLLAGLAGKPSPFSTIERQTPWKDITSYNNFYEFGTGKTDPVRYADSLKTSPWTVTVEGEVHKPRTFDLDELLKLSPMEERIYRMRCVEGWSMVIPWVGYSLNKLIEAVQPTGNARFVEFVTLADKAQMPGLSYPVLDWPYVEGLRLDEAMHPLTLLGFGLYGRVLPKQNGAPVRLVVPWKYGFKSAKSLVRIRFVEKQPLTSWVKAGPREYGFYSNVNPEVPHPRWSQATERRIGEGGFFAPKRKTLMFNGYADQVASLYTGMDLRKDF